MKTNNWWKNEKEKKEMILFEFHNKIQNEKETHKEAMNTFEKVFISC